MATAQNKSDLQIRDEVLAELKWDTRVLPTEIGVEVRGGIVTLSGTVDSWAKKVAGREAARRVWGVTDVANDIIVHIPDAMRPTDADIAATVRHALERDVLVPADRIQTTVSDGLVTLEGDVEFWSHAEDAERAVRNLAGVIGIVNLIKVQHAAKEREVQRAIEAALNRHAARTARHVKVDLEGSGATVTGYVDSWAERTAVVGAIRGTPGVTSVEDRLSIW